MRSTRSLIKNKSTYFHNAAVQLLAVSELLSECRLRILGDESHQVADTVAQEGRRRHDGDVLRGVRVLPSQSNVQALKLSKYISIIDMDALKNQFPTIASATY